MNKAKFVAGGGWVKRSETSRPITRWMALAAAFSWVPALAVLVVTPLDSSGFWEEIRSFPSCLVFLPPPVLMLFSLLAYFLESPRTISTVAPNPNYDPHNLY